MSEKEWLSHLQQFEKKELVWPFCCIGKWDTGRKEEGIPALSSSAVAIQVQPRILCPCKCHNLRLGLATFSIGQLLSFALCKESCVAMRATFHAWRKRPKLCLAGSEAVGESWVGLSWDLTGIYQSPIWDEAELWLLGSLLHPQHGLDQLLHIMVDS